MYVRFPKVLYLVAAHHTVAKVDMVAHLQSVVGGLLGCMDVPLGSRLLQLVVGLLVSFLEAEAVFLDPVDSTSSSCSAAPKEVIDWKPRLLTKQQEVWGESRGGLWSVVVSLHKF